MDANNNSEELRDCTYIIVQTDGFYTNAFMKTDAQKLKRIVLNGDCTTLDKIPLNGLDKILKASENCKILIFKSDMMLENNKTIMEMIVENKHKADNISLIVLDNKFYIYYSSEITVNTKRPDLDTCKLMSNRYIKNKESSKLLTKLVYNLYKIRDIVGLAQYLTGEHEDFYATVMCNRSLKVTDKSLSINDIKRKLDVEYYKVCVEQLKGRADESDDSTIRKIDIELGDRYTELIQKVPDGDFKKDLESAWYQEYSKIYYTEILKETAIKALDEYKCKLFFIIDELNKHDIFVLSINLLIGLQFIAPNHINTVDATQLVERVFKKYSADNTVRRIFAKSII